jgi:hypothetical protein
MTWRLVGAATAACPESAQQSANPERPDHRPCAASVHGRRMGKIIHVRFRRSRLPRRLLDDGWWLQTPPARACVIAFPKRDGSRPRPGPRHLTVITNPGK